MTHDHWWRSSYEAGLVFHLIHDSILLGHVTEIHFIFFLLLQNCMYPEQSILIFFWISDLYFFMHWCNILYCKKGWLTRVVGTGAWAFLIEFFLLFFIGYICKPCVSKISNPLLLLAVVGYEGILFYLFWCVNMQWKVMMLYGYK